MPKIFLYLSSLIGILFIFFGVLSFFVSKKNNQPQSQINNVQEIKNQEEEKIEEINQETNNEEEIKIEEETLFEKIIFIIMTVIIFFFEAKRIFYLISKPELRDLSGKITFKRVQDFLKNITIQGLVTFFYILIVIKKEKKVIIACFITEISWFFYYKIVKNINKKIEEKQKEKKTLEKLEKLKKLKSYFRKLINLYKMFLKKNIKKNF